MSRQSSTKKRRESRKRIESMKSGQLDANFLEDGSFRGLETLEQRLLMSGSAPELSGLHLVDPTVDRFDGQVIHLDFDGAQDIDYNGPVTVEGIDIPAFAAPDSLVGKEQAIIADILTRLEATFSDIGLTFVTEEPDLGSPHSTIYIGGTDAAFAEYGSFLGLAEKVDVGNRDPADEAFVFADALMEEYPSHMWTSVIQEHVAHEAAHLLGYAHDSARVEAADLPLADYATVWGGSKGLLTFDTWNQGSPSNRTNNWNRYTPLDGPGTSNGTYVGCVATALAQVLWYWQFPNSAHFEDLPHRSGGESYEYSDGTNGSQNVDNDAGILDFPDFDDLNSALASINYRDTPANKALLSFAAGISVQMDYDGEGSGAFISNVRDALLDTWGYGSASFSYDWTAEVKDRVIANIKQGMPVIFGLDGTKVSDGTGAAHALIIEGYNDETDQFMINFGWGPQETSSYIWCDLGDPASGKQADFSRGGYRWTAVNEIVYDINPATGWAQAFGNAEHTGQSTYAGPTSLRERWNATPQHSRQAFQGLIVGEGGKVYALSGTMDLNQGNSSYLQFLDAQGTKIGEAVIPDEFEVEGDAQSHLAQGPNGQIYFATTRNLYRFNPKNSQISTLKTLGSGESFEGAIVVDDDGNLYLRSFEHSSPNRNRVYSFTANGSRRWVYTLSSGHQVFHDIAVDSARNRLLIPYANLGVNTGLIMLDSSNMSVLGQRSWPGASSSSRLVKSPSIGPDGTIYVARYNELYALHPDASLSRKWIQSTSPGLAGGPPTIGRDHLYVAHWVSNSKIALTARNLQSGAIEWQYERNAGDYDYTMPIVVGANGMVSFVHAHKTAGKPATFTLFQIEDRGGTSYTLRDSRNLGTQGGNIVLGPENIVYVIGREKITALNDGSRGDAYSGGMGYTDNGAPASATNTGIVDGSIVQGDQVTLSWQSSDPDGHGLTYDLLVGSIGELAEGQQPTGAMSPAATELTKTSFVLKGLQPGRQYLWQVVASDGQAAVSSEIWSFDTLGAVSEVNVSALDDTAGEPDDDGKFLIRRTGSIASPLTVNFSMEDSTATRNDDYSLKRGSVTISGNSVTIPAGQSSIDLLVDVIDDMTVEGTESVKLKIENGSGYTVGSPSSETIDILDNDSASSITVVTPSSGENWQSGTINTISWDSENNPGSNVKIDLYRGNSFDHTITSSTPDDGAYSWTIPLNQAAGNSYQIKITSTSEPAISDFSNGTFSISAILSDTYESDDSWAEAAKQYKKNKTHRISTTGVSQTHSIHSPSDQDWTSFKINGNKGADVAIWTSGDAGNDTKMTLMRKQGRKLLTLTSDDDGGSGKNARIEWHLRRGKYFVKVTGDGANTIDSYDLHVDATGDGTTVAPDAMEQDNTKRDGNKKYKFYPIALKGTPQQHSLHVANDADWVKFVLKEKMSAVTIRTTGNAGGDTRVSLYKGRNLLASDYSTGYSTIEGVLLKKGTYFIAIQENGQDETVDVYELSVNAVSI